MTTKGIHCRSTVTMVYGFEITHFDTFLTPCNTKQADDMFSTPPAAEHDTRDRTEWIRTRLVVAVSPPLPPDVLPRKQVRNQDTCTIDVT